MKKISFIKGWIYLSEDFSFLEDSEQEKYFKGVALEEGAYMCWESFTAEITVKIVPYEQV